MSTRYPNFIYLELIKSSRKQMLTRVSHNVIIYFYCTLLLPYNNKSMVHISNWQIKISFKFVIYLTECMIINRYGKILILLKEVTQLEWIVFD